MWLRAAGFAGWWFASGVFALALTFLPAYLLPATPYRRAVIIVYALLFVLWTCGCALAATVKRLALVGWFFRCSAARLYGDMAPFCKEARRSLEHQTMNPDQPVLWDLEALQHRYFRLFYHRLHALARETERRYDVYPPPPALLHPMSFEEMERNTEWVWSLTRCRAYAR
jgi:hypothetical protein